MDFDNFEENDFDCEIESAFVGRSHDLEKLSGAWRNHKVFGVFGIRSVGKSRLIKEFLRLQKQKNTKLQELYIDLKIQTDIQSIHSNICAGLEVTPEVNAIENGKWIRQICSEIATRTAHGQVSMVTVFDNAEDILESEDGDKLKSLFASLITQTRYTKILITSTTKVLFAQYQHIFFNYEVLPLPPTESLALLKSIIGDEVDLGEYRDVIVRLSEGLPLLILMIGGELMEDRSMITPADMVELLSNYRLRTLSQEYYGEDDRVADVYTRFIGRLTKFYTRRFSILEFIPGSFNAAEAKQMLDYKSIAQVKGDVLIHLRRRFMLTYDQRTKRFNIQGILRECLHTYFALSNITEVRRKYYNTFSRVMLNISERLGSEDCAKALSEFTLEQANLQKLLTEVFYTREDTYHFFIEIASTCTTLIENFMAGNSERFYDGCLKCTEMYGKPKDKSIIHVALGSLYTNVKGDYPKGAHNLKQALEYLETGPRDIHLATAYQRLGWNLHSQGRNNKAVGFFEKSLSISSLLGKQGELLKLQSLNSLGITNTLLGHLDKAETYHFRSLAIRREVQGPKHPSVGATLNNIGIFYDQKDDAENALKYYTEGLEIKRLSKNTPVISIVYSLNNIAAKYSRLKQFEEAHQKLDEALQLLNSQEVPSKDGIALTHDTRGKVFQAEKKFKLAVQQFEKAVRIRRDLAPNGITYVESLVHAANSYCSMGEYQSSLQAANKALAIREKAKDSMPHNTFITECLEVVGKVYRCTNKDKKYIQTLGEIESELIRLEKVNMAASNYRKVDKIRAQLTDVKCKLDNLLQAQSQQCRGEVQRCIYSRLTSNMDLF